MYTYGNICFNILKQTKCKKTKIILKSKAPPINLGVCFGLAIHTEKGLPWSVTDIFCEYQLYKNKFSFPKIY